MKVKREIRREFNISPKRKKHKINTRISARRILLPECFRFEYVVEKRKSLYGNYSSKHRRHCSLEAGIPSLCSGEAHPLPRKALVITEAHEQFRHAMLGRTYWLASCKSFPLCFIYLSIRLFISHMQKYGRMSLSVLFIYLFGYLFLTCRNTPARPGSHAVCTLAGLPVRRII